jgi:PUB domain/Ubiquitin family
MADEHSNTITIQLTVTAAQGAPRVPLAVGASITPTVLRQQAAEATKIPVASIKIIFRGRLIADSDNLSAVAEYKLEEGSVLHCMGKPATEGSTPTSTMSAATILPTVSVQPYATATATVPAAAAATAEADPLKAALTVLRTSNSPTVYQTAVTTLDKLLSNILQNPMEEKYRSLKVENPAFQRRLGGVPGGDAAIKACGFTVETVEAGDDRYVMAASPEKWPALLASKATVEQAVAQANLLANNHSSTAAAHNFGGPAMPYGFGAEDIPPFGVAGMPDSPEMRQAVAQIMSNPQQLQAMLQVRSLASYASLFV